MSIFFFFAQGWLSGARTKKKKKKKKKEKKTSWEAIFMLARFTIPKKKQGSTRKLNHQVKCMITEHSTNIRWSSIMRSRVLNILTSKMYSNVGTFSWGFKHTNDNAVRELFIYFRKSSVGTCYIEENRKNLLCSTMLTCR